MKALPTPQDELARFTITNNWSVRVWGSGVGQLMEVFLFDFIESETSNPVCLSQFEDITLLHIPQQSDRVKKMELPEGCTGIRVVEGNTIGESYFSLPGSIYALCLADGHEVVFRMPQSGRPASGRDAGIPVIQASRIFG